MKLEEIRKDYERYSTKVSDLNRKLIFAGIAVIWIFRVTSSGKTEIPKELITPLFWFILSLGADILQYIIQSLIWYFYYSNKKRKLKCDNTEQQIVNEPEWPNIFSWLLWITKVGATVFAYVKLAIYLSII